MNYNKICLFLIVIIFAFVFTGCATPPENLQKAQISTDDSDSNNKDGVDIVSSSTGVSIVFNFEDDSGEDESNEKMLDNKEVINVKEKSFEFEGYGPGKSHLGTFEILDVNLTYKDNNLIELKTVIDAMSVKTDIGLLTTHLQGKDFFDARKNPFIMFETTQITKDKMTGNLNFRGIEKQVSFNYNINETNINADFLLNTVPFGMENTGVNDEVRIVFDLVLE